MILAIFGRCLSTEIGPAQQPKIRQLESCFETISSLQTFIFYELGGFGILIFQFADSSLKCNTRPSSQ